MRAAFVVLVGSTCLWMGCDNANPASTSAPRHELPVQSFSAPQAWRPTWGDGPAVEPPDLDVEIWRAFVNQFEPMQRETPLWQDLPARETVRLKMPEGNRHQCVVGPVDIAPQPDDFGARLEHWVMQRILSCSSDDFATWTSYPHRIALGTDGARRVLVESGALLQERAADGAIRESLVVMRSDKEVRSASLGAPQVLPGVEVTD